MEGATNLKSCLNFLPFGIFMEDMLVSGISSSKMDLALQTFQTSLFLGHPQQHYAKPLVGKILRYLLSENL